MKTIFLVILLNLFTTMADAFEKDVIKTSEGDLVITFIGHGSLLFNFKNLNIHVDPYSKLADYSKLPKADLIFITHEHRDHLDLQALKLITFDNTALVCNEESAKTAPKAKVMKNGDETVIKGIKINAVPAYNLKHKRENGQPYHPKGKGNGYVLSLGDKRVYIAGDTENIPEIQALKDVDIAFLPMNLPYTMTPEMVADAAKKFQPKILYTYHFGETDTTKLVELLKEDKQIEVRIRKMK